MFEGLPNPPKMTVTTNGTVWNSVTERVLDSFSTDIRFR